MAVIVRSTGIIPIGEGHTSRRGTSKITTQYWASDESEQKTVVREMTIFVAVSVQSDEGLFIPDRALYRAEQNRSFSGGRGSDHSSTARANTR